MKILFLYHPYVNAGMTRALCAVSESVFCPPKKSYVTPEGSRRMNWREFLSLRKRIQACEFDLIIAYACEEGLWRNTHSFFSNLVHATKKLLFYFPAFALRLLLPTIKASGTKLLIYDYDDLTVIPPMRRPFLDACHLYFKRHPAVNLNKSFLFQTKRDGSLWNVLRNPQYQVWVKKIRPIGYGTDYQDYFAECLATEKKYDVFFSGGLHYSPVRQDGREALDALQAEGLRICLPAKVPHREFLRLCSESWLVLSPEGAEWHSARHYESLLMKSVPVINYPNVLLHRPLLNGVHVIYYPPEKGLLADIIRQALKDKPRLQKIAEEGHQYVLKHHTNDQVVKWMIRQANGEPDPE
jgi:hypothetical protein